MTDNSASSTDNAAPTAATAAELRDDRFVGERDLTSWPSRFGQLLAAVVHHLSRRLGSSAALIATLLVGLALTVALTSVSAEVYEAVTEGDGVAELDHPILDEAITLRSPALDAAATSYTNVAGKVGMPLIALSALTILGVKRRSWTPVIVITSAAVGSLLMTIVGKQVIGRSRPPLRDAVPPYEYSASFPSGHTLNAVVVAGVVAYLLILRQHTRRARVITVVVAVLFAFTVGMSRVYLGHHWFSDVVGAWTIGVAWLALVITAHRLYLTAKSRSPASE